MNKKIVFATFKNHQEAERAIQELQSDLSLDMEDVSYIYRDNKGNIQDDEGEDRSDAIVGSGAKGASMGATIGAIAGLATVAGIIPFIGPVFAAGPLIAALGLGTGAVATTAAGAVTGAMAGGVAGALLEWGLPSDVANDYQDRVNSGETLVAVATDSPSDVEQKLRSSNATSVTNQNAEK